MTLHLKSRGYPFRPRVLFPSFIVVGVGFPTVYYFRRGQLLYRPLNPVSQVTRESAEKSCVLHLIVESMPYDCPIWVKGILLPLR